MSEYPNIDNFNIESPEELLTWVNGDLKNWIKEVTRLRYEDTGDKDTLPDMYVRGRKSPRIPNSPTDVTDFDKVGDISYDGQWLYVLVEVSEGVLRWSRTQLSASDPWPVPATDKASVPDAQEGENDTRFMTPLTTDAAIKANALGGSNYAISGNLIGNGRAANTNYTNDTDSPIFVSATSVGTNASACRLLVDGVDMFTNYSRQQNATNIVSVCGIVPAGSIYRVNTIEGALTLWYEYSV